MALTRYETSNEETEAPILICLLGSFSLVKTGRPVEVRSGGKTESLLSCLALRPDHCAPRDTLLSTLWPNSESGLAGQSLHSLVCWLPLSSARFVD